MSKKEKHSPRRREGHEEEKKRLTFFWFPSSSLGTAKPKLQLRETGSWSFQACIPKLELGNE
ncbi:MAG: hypothetical protein WCS87_19070 [Methylococcaceae bacterium]